MCGNIPAWLIQFFYQRVLIYEFYRKSFRFENLFKIRKNVLNILKVCVKWVPTCFLSIWEQRIWKSVCRRYFNFYKNSLVAWLFWNRCSMIYFVFQNGSGSLETKDFFLNIFPRLSFLNAKEIRSSMTIEVVEIYFRRDIFQDVCFISFPYYYIEIF